MFFIGGSYTGCDSTHITNLTIVQPSVSSSSPTTCDSAIIGGNTYTNSQSVTTVVNGGALNGCDSIHITNLTVLQSAISRDTLIVCDSATINENSYYSSQTVTDVFILGASNGCDSIHVTNLTVLYTAISRDTLKVCDSAIINGNSYYHSQIIEDTFHLAAASGCDSIHITNLTINSSSVSTSSFQTCISAIINGVTYTSSQIVTDVFVGGAANGCDSTHITNLNGASASNI